MRHLKISFVVLAAMSVIGCAQPRVWNSVSNSRTSAEDLLSAKTDCQYDQKAELIHRSIGAASSYLMAGDIGKEKHDIQMARARETGAEIAKCMKEHGFVSQSTKLSY